MSALVVLLEGAPKPPAGKVWRAGAAAEGGGAAGGAAGSSGGGGGGGGGAEAGSGAFEGGAPAS
jgi:hypothetical protein